MDQHEQRTTWTGRTDGPEDEHARWHQRVRRCPGARPEDLGEPGPVLLGFASDEGVARNRGRTGAAAAPAPLRRALAPLAWHPETGRIHDLGDVAVDGHDLEGAQERLGALLAPHLAAGRTAVVLGGGHETAYATYRGWKEGLARGGTRVGVVNLDAHFDLRRDDRPSSGTPFLQMHEEEAAEGRQFRYLVLGISEANNTRVLFDTAGRIGAGWVLDEHCTPDRLPQLRQTLDSFLDGVDAVHLTVDLDVLPAATAPGVSAPAGLGVPLEVVHALVAQVADSGKLVLVEAVELNPRFDVDDRTARTAARLLHTAVTRAARR